MTEPDDKRLPFKARLKGTERRALIEAVAARHFAEHGYAATTLDDVAAEAGVSRPVIYDHFRSKRGLHDALLERHTRELMSFVAQRLASQPPDLKRQLRGGVSAFFEFVEADPYAWRILLRDPLVEGTATVVDQRVQADVTAALATIIAESLAQSGQRVDPPDRIVRFAEALRWICNGLASWWYDHRTISREELVDTVMELCWTGLERTVDGPQP